MKGRRGNPGLRGQLLDKSMEAYVLALEIINQLSVKYRIETFAYLVCNAWELLLKARIIDQTGKRLAIYHKKKPGEPRRSWSLRQCLKHAFLDEKDPTRRNVELVADLRDEAVHLVMAQVPRDVLGLFQACVLNYHNRLREWFDVSLSDRVSVGMMTIVYDLSPEELDLSNAVLRRHLGRDATDYLLGYQAQIREESEQLGRDPVFSIEIDYKLALVKKAGEADIVFTSGESGTAVVPVEVPKDPCKTHPYRRKELVQQLNAALPDGVSINGHDVQCAVKVYNGRQRPEWYYKGTIPGSPCQYSPVFRDWLLARCKQDTSFFEETRAKARAT